ncbi:MAG: tRNA (N6-isopentenyl adenosine(37)-C2)-methylthiotransferase MiaB [Leptospirales bacterium]|nr:tRNA (N6-isopentenyl adenosine(37)-C2)-methylthiotransferase MiaB [Leptospirales bacterium]
MNKNDSELMRLSLCSEGYVPSAKIDEADIVIYNTCSVREHAENRVRARIASDQKSVRGRGGLIIVAGCMAQRVGPELIKDKTADMVIGPYQSPAIGEKLRGYFSGEPARLFLSQAAEDFESRLKGTPGGWRAWLTITHGCANFCAYCIVPYVRGRLISFNSADIIERARRLAAEGALEITLLGQNVNQFGQDTGDIPFYSLLEKIAAIPGLARLNFLTSHPRDFSEDIIMVIADNPNISRSVHLPLQSGSDKILALMNRAYTMSHYRALIDMIGKRLNEYSVTTDLIVGFPEESEDDYNATLSAVREIRFDEAFTYAYSPREGTPAAVMEETCGAREKTERLNELIAIQRKISKDKLLARLNRVEEVIPEKVSRRGADELVGRTSLNHPAVISGSARDIGKPFKIRIDAVNGSTLRGIRIA